MNQLLASVVGNDVFTGVVGGSLVASALYAVRSLPAGLFSLIVWRFTSELVVYNEDAAFDVVSNWLASLDYAKRARRLRMTSSGRDEEVSFSPGIGKHLIWYRGRPVIVKRYLPEQKGSGGSSWKRREDITIQTLGTTPELLHELIGKIMEARDGAHRTMVEIHMFSGYWRLACRRNKRALHSVVMNAEQRAAIVADLERFAVSREWYAARGVPYRRGILFHGPPGCGKTSLVVALASHFSKPIYALNIGSLQNDEALIDAVTTVPENAVLLIEDIDAAQAKRTDEEETGNPDGKKQKGITLSALLNAIDGVFARDGRILFMTTNHPEKLDPALRRPGRADREEHIGEIGHGEVLDMCRQFLGNELLARSVANRVPTPIAPALLQRRLLNQEVAVENELEAAE